MAELAALLARTRLELSDQDLPFRATRDSDGATTRYELPSKAINEDSLWVALDDGTTETQLLPDEYELNALRGYIDLADPVPVGQRLRVAGIGHRFFTDEQHTIFIESALAKHTNRTTMTMEDLPPVEEHLVAILAKIEALWVLATDASYDIAVFTPEGVSIPKEQRYRQLMAMIDNEQQRYRLMAQQLNVGLSRVEVSTLRRISKKTGRLVPLYVSQEFDDRRRPARMYPGIDEQSTTVRPDYLPALPAYNEAPPDPP